MSFLPETYKIPSTSNYMRLAKGENRFRVLGSAIVGWERWINEDGSRKPIRSKKPFEASVVDPDNLPKHFWAFPVWNYGEERIQILELTQKTIMSAITSLISNEEWGDVKDFDIIITRDGDGFETTYATLPSPHKPISKEIEKQYKDTSINLEILFEGGDPFLTIEPPAEDFKA